MNKQNASSDKKRDGEGLLPAKVIWRASQIARQLENESHSVEAEPAPVEMIGLTIGILRRKKHISHLQFAQRIGCSVEELLALEAGLLPGPILMERLPAILREIGTGQNFLQLLINRIKFA